MVRLRPAVSELVIAAGVSVILALVIGAAFVRSSEDVVRAAAVFVAMTVGMAAGMIGERARIVAEATPAGKNESLERRGALALTHAPVFVVLGGLALLPAFGPGPACAGLAATGVYELLLAAQLWTWERETGRTLLLRPIYRWRGTNGRRVGRGWFDPANFRYHR